MSSWQVLDEQAHALTIEYFFGPKSTARAFAVRFANDELAILSPPVGLDAAAHEQLKDHGRVTALVAPNGMHWLGVAPAIEVFPEAKVYAPSAAIKRIQKRQPAIEFRPLSELSTQAEAGIGILDVPGFSIGETWAVVDTAHGPIWYVSDSCLNVSKLPSALPVKLFMKWTKSGPGLCFNGMSNLLFLKDKPGYKRWFQQQLEQPPRTLVPAHGDVVSGAHLAEELGRLLELRL